MKVDSVFFYVLYQIWLSILVDKSNRKIGYESPKVIKLNLSNLLKTHTQCFIISAMYGSIIIWITIIIITMKVVTNYYDSSNKLLWS